MIWSLGELFGMLNMVNTLNQVLKQHYIEDVICKVYNESDNKIDSVPTLVNDASYTENLKIIFRERGATEEKITETSSFLTEVSINKDDLQKVKLSREMETIVTKISGDYGEFSELNFHYGIARMLVNCGWSL